MRDAAVHSPDNVVHYTNSGSRDMFVSLTIKPLRALQGPTHCTRCVPEPCVVPVGVLFNLVGLCVAAVILCAKFYTLLL
jgi:hypothetical protein